MENKENLDNIKQEIEFIDKIKKEISKVVVGQEKMVNSLIMAILANGHILLEGVPGLAKTTLINTLSMCMELDFKRIQFTPDLLPADLIGTQIYLPKEGEFKNKKGPIFSNIILADEINRAPSKVQSALLEAMQEKQVTIGNVTYNLPKPFFVLATQNPIDQEGTYSLPEAQIDRFIFKVKVGYPTKKEEKEIIKKNSSLNKSVVEKVIKPSDIFRIRETINNIYVDDKIQDFILDIVFASRKPNEYNLKNLTNYITFGASPRASIFLNNVGKVQAFLKGRNFVIPEDIKDIANDILRHRIILSYEAEADGISSDDIIDLIIKKINKP